MSSRVANLAYVAHRDQCNHCGAVDLGYYGVRRCLDGQKLVRAAAKETKERLRILMRRKPFITAKDFILLRKMGISL